MCKCADMWRVYPTSRHGVANVFGLLILWTIAEFNKSNSRQLSTLNYPLSSGQLTSTHGQRPSTLNFSPFLRPTNLGHRSTILGCHLSTMYFTPVNLPFGPRSSDNGQRSPTVNS